MDILCFHENKEILGNIENSLKALGLNLECMLLKENVDIEREIEEKNPRILLLPEKLRDSVKNVNIIKIFIGKEGGDDCIATDDDWSEFQHQFMKILLEKKSELGDLFKNEEIIKNIIYAYGFSWGRTFIVDASDGKKIRKILPNLASEKVNFFIAVRERPEDFRELKNSKVIWVTDIVGKDRIKPHNLTILTDSIIRYIEEKKNAIVLMDCIEYLLIYNDFVNILRNIELINSYVMEHHALMIIIVDSKAYTTKEYSLLSRYALKWKGV